MKLGAKKFFFVLISVNVLLVVATIAVFVFASSIAQKKSNQIAQLKSDNQTNDQLISYYRVLQGTLNANKNLQAILQQVLPSDKNQSAALNDLDSFAKSSNVTVSQISFSPGTNLSAGQTLTSPSSIKGVAIISVTLTCTATHYENLLEFLQDIERTQRRMQVTSVNITPNVADPNLLDQVTLSIDIYLKTGA